MCASSPASASRRARSPRVRALATALAVVLSTWRSSLAVLAKDLAIEVATREIVTTAGFFAALVAIMASVAFTTGPETTTRVAPGALWLALAFASVLAVG